MGALSYCFAFWLGGLVLEPWPNPSSDLLSISLQICVVLHINYKRNAAVQDNVAGASWYNQYDGKGWKIQTKPLIFEAIDYHILSCADLFVQIIYKDIIIEIKIDHCPN